MDFSGLNFINIKFQAAKRKTDESNRSMKQTRRMESKEQTEKRSDLFIDSSSEIHRWQFGHSRKKMIKKKLETKRFLIKHADQISDHSHETQKKTKTRERKTDRNSCEFKSMTSKVRWKLIYFIRCRLIIVIIWAKING